MTDWAMALKVFILGFPGVFVTLATLMPRDIDLRLHQQETIYGKGRSGDGASLFNPIVLKTGFVHLYWGTCGDVDNRVCFHHPRYKNS